MKLDLLYLSSRSKRTLQVKLCQSLKPSWGCRETASVQPRLFAVCFLQVEDRKQRPERKAEVPLARRFVGLRQLRQWMAAVQEEVRHLSWPNVYLTSA